MFVGVLHGMFKSWKVAVSKKGFFIIPFLLTGSRLPPLPRLAGVKGVFFCVSTFRRPFRYGSEMKNFILWLRQVWAKISRSNG